MKTDRLVGLAKTYLDGFEPSDPLILQKLKAAEAELKRELRVLLEPTTIFPYTPTEEEIGALDGEPYLEEPGYDYDPEFFRAERWGYIVARQHPIISVEFVRFAYPAPTTQFFALPSDWLRIDKKYGHIRMVPASSSFAAPLGAFLLQALGGGSTIPSMIQVKYKAGLANAREDFPDLIDLLYKKASLSLIEDQFVPGGGSISADGLSQSFSVKLQDYRDMVDRKMNGPKGANGGLFTAIHGIQAGFLGTMA